MADVGIDAMPAGVEVVRGKPALLAKVGKERVRHAIASTRFAGAKRAVPRGTWSGYVYERENDVPIVSAPTDQEIVRSSFLQYPLLVAALRSAAALAQGAPTGPRGDQLVHGPSGWSVQGSAVLGLDTEGFNRVERVSLADSTQCCSWQWSEAARAVVQAAVDAASIVLIHYAAHDLDLLAQAGVDVPYHKVRCTMEAGRILAPWRNKGLGYMAPVFAAVSPWKGAMGSDETLYSATDAWVLPRMWEQQGALLKDRYLEEIHLADQHIACLYHARRIRASYTRDGMEGALERASCLMETAGVVEWNLGEGQVLHEVPLTGNGVAVGIRDPYVSAYRCLSGHQLDLPGDIRRRAGIVRYLRGDGVDVARRGLLDTYPTRRALLDAIDPEVTAWHERVAESLRRDDHVANPIGRRWYYGTSRMATRFLLESTIMDTYRRQVLASQLVPVHQSLYHAAFASPDDAASFLSNQSRVLPKLEVLPRT